MIMHKGLRFLASALFLATVVDAHTFDKYMSMEKVAAQSKSIEIPPAGGSRPVGSFGIATGSVSSFTYYSSHNNFLHMHIYTHLHTHLTYPYIFIHIYTYIPVRRCGASRLHRRCFSKRWHVH